MIETIQLFPGVTLRCHRDDRFKQGCLSLQFVRPMGPEASKNALLPAVWLRGTKKHPDLRSITLRLDDLYGASVSALVRRIGDYQTTGLYCGFMEDRFAMDGDRILAPMASFLRELLLEPVLTDGGFSREFVESEKKNLISTLETERNDKRAYAAGQLLRTMCREDSFGIPRLGRVAWVKEIDAVSLYQHHQKLLKESAVELFYVGSQPVDTVAELLRPLFADLPRDWKPLPGQKAFRDAGNCDKTEKVDTKQSQLCLGFVTNITIASPQFAAMQVLNTIFGGGMTSKLFMNVREKMSLCYSVGSGYYGSKGIVTVNAGIDAAREGVARQEILRQLLACQSGDITGEELAAAKEAVLSGLRGVHDSPSAIEGYYATGNLSGLGMTPEMYREKIEAVTMEDVVAVAGTLRLHTRYFLEGVGA